MHKFWLCIWLLCFLQSLDAQTYDFRNYNVDDGLSQSQVFCIFQDSKGYMWFGTNGGGASKFDGKKFQSLTPANGGISNYVFAITEDKNQNMYLATYDGLQIKGSYRNIRLDSTKGLPGNETWSVFIDKSNKVWFGTKQGIFYLDADLKPVKLKGDQTLEEAAVWTIYQDLRGEYWFGTMQHGLCCYAPANKEKPFTWYTEKEGLGSNFIRSLNEDTKGDIWVGTVAGLSKVRMESGKLERIILPTLVSWNLAFTSLLRDRNENLWLASNEGVLKINGLGFERFSDTNGLCSNVILSSFIDNEGDLWFGSDGAGISKLSSEAVTNLSSRNGLPADYINCIYQAKDKSYWFGVRDNGLARKKGKSITMFRMNTHRQSSELADNNVNCIAEDKGGKIWVGTMAGLSILDGNPFRNYLTGDNDHQTIYSMHHSADGLHYLGTLKGLHLFDNGKLTSIEAVNSLVEKGDFPIYGITEDKNKDLWLATAKGAIRYDGKNAQLFNSKNKLTDKTVYNVVNGSDGNLWFGTEEGVFYYDYKDFVRLGEKEGLASDMAYFLLFDNKNRLWIGTNKGIDQLNVNDFVHSKKINIKHFGKEEGLQGLECNFNSAFKDIDGRLWFGTVKGITIFNPRFEKTNYHEPACSITDIKIAFEKIDLSKYSKGVDSLSGLPIKLELPYAKNHITFNFIGISQTNPDKVQYEFKLDGVDADWVPPTNKTEVTYSSLQPGDYIFYLKAMNNDGVWNKEPIRFKFTILPPWYRTWWFYSICIILALISIYAYNTYKTKKLREDKIKLEKEVAARTHELRAEKEKVEVINKEVIEQKAVIEHKNLEITDSIRYAKNIQEALLPAITVLQKDFPESFVLYMPKDIVSGDFYWFTKREGKNYFAAADCTGHGVPGAFMSIIGNTLLNEIISEQRIYEPAEILNNLHVGVKTSLNQNKGEFERRDGMDIALCAIDKETLTLEYAGANRPLWIYRKNAADKAEIVKPDKFPIGGIEFEFEEKRKFNNHIIKLQKDDCLYIFSDGYADQFGGTKGKKFMVANLQRAFTEIVHMPMNKQYELLYKIFTDWRGHYEQVDDVLMIGLRV